MSKGTGRSHPVLDVQWLGEEAVGQVINPGTIAFGYHQSWLQGGANLSPLRVPFTAALHRLRDDAFDQLPGFLADALPDSWGREIMALDFASHQLSATPLNMLAWVGRRAIGALEFEPAEESSKWAEVQPMVLAREAQAVLGKAPVEAFSILRTAGTAGGAFPKATVALCADGSMLAGGDVRAVRSPHPGARLGILKLDAEDSALRPSTDGRLENAYMAMARRAGIHTAGCHVIGESGFGRERHHLFVDRFDVTPDGGRLHMVTLAGVLETFRHLTYNELLGATRQLTGDQREVNEAVRRMIFNVRAGNGDDHGKNHAFLFDRKAGRWTLSPAYDLTLNHSANSTFHGLSSTTFGRTPTVRRMADLAADHGVANEEFEAMDRDVCMALDAWPEIANACNLQEPAVEKVTGKIAVIRDAVQRGVPSRAPQRRRLW